MKGIAKTLARLEKEGLYPDFHTISDGVNDPICTVDGKQYLMFSSNNYMSMTQNPAVKTAAKKAIDQYGVGPGGSRVISGNLDIIEQFEAAMADLTGTEACLTFPTGYMANVSIFTALMDPFFFDYPAKSEESVIFSDEYNHGSIVDGCRLSKAKKVVFKHNDLADLEAKLKEHKEPNKLIVTEGVFSLEGEILPVPAYLALAKRYKAMLMIDDAHGIGVLGEHGGGVADLYNCGDKIDIVMGCMDKAFGGTGGYICGSKTMIKFLRVSARSSMLSSSFPSVAAAAMLEAVKQIKAGQSVRKDLFEKSDYLRSALQERGFKCVGSDILPAIALHIGDEGKGIEFSKLLWDKGIYCITFRWPAVPLKQSRLRISVMADHTYAQLDQFIEATYEVGKQLRMVV